MSTRIDWPQLLADLAHMLGDDDPLGRRMPLNHYGLANALSVPRGTLRGWLDGSEPKHSDGERLVDRWRVLSGKPAEFAPRERKGLTAHTR